MNCSRCRAALVEGNEFCGKCGGKVVHISADQTKPPIVTRLVIAVWLIVGVVAVLSYLGGPITPPGKDRGNPATHKSREMWVSECTELKYRPQFQLSAVDLDEIKDCKALGIW